MNQHTDQAPPAYDSLSMSPPTSTEDSHQDTASHGHMHSLKQKWKDLKEEDKARKSNQVQYVTPEEADRITGLDKRREAEAEENKDSPKGVKRFLGLMTFL